MSCSPLSPWETFGLVALSQVPPPWAASLMLMSRAIWCPYGRPSSSIVAAAKPLPRIFRVVQLTKDDG